MARSNGDDTALELPVEAPAKRGNARKATETKPPAAARPIVVPKMDIRMMRVRWWVTPR